MSLRYLWVLLATVASFTASAQDYTMLPEFDRLTGIYKSAGIQAINISLAKGNVPAGEGGTLYSKSFLNADGQEMKTMFYLDSQLYATNTYEFNNGKRMKMHQTFAGNPYQLWHNYLYDSTGRLLSITEHNNANTNLIRVEYEYFKGKLSAIRYYTATGPDIENDIWTYSDKKEYFWYDDKGRLSSVGVVTPEQELMSYYSYDQNGRLTRVEKYDVYYVLDVEDFLLLTTEKYQYNSNGTIDRIVVTDAAAAAEETTIYTYEGL